MSTQLYWYEAIKKMLYMYPDKLREEGTIQSELAEVSIRNAIDYTRQNYIDGEDRIKFFETVYFNKNGTFTQTVLSMYICQRTAEKWNHDFIYLIAENMGFRNSGNNK